MNELEMTTQKHTGRLRGAFFGMNHIEAKEIADHMDALQSRINVLEPALAESVEMCRTLAASQGKIKKGA